MAAKLFVIIVATLLTAAVLLSLRHERIVTAHRMAETLNTLRQHERTLAELRQRTSERMRLREIRRLREGLGVPLKPLVRPEVPGRSEPAPSPPATPRAVTAAYRGAR